MKPKSTKKHYDEHITSLGRSRAGLSNLVSWMKNQRAKNLKELCSLTEVAIKEMGISFSVYSEGNNVDRLWPFDIIPRAITRREWTVVSKGLSQRTKALNAFIHDVYNRQKILAEDVVPAELVLDSQNYRVECAGIRPRHNIWAHICGTDLVRNHQGHFYVLEDNLRIPSGVSYMIENRELTKRVLPELFANHSILPVDDYPSQLFKMLISVAPVERKKPCVVVLTPGIYNSAYFEHAYLAREMGIELVEGPDLKVGNDEHVYMQTVEGLVKVDVIYRRVDEDFLDPEVFRKDSILGIPGIMRSWLAGKVSIVNAPGSGVADDKAIYAFVPTMIRYYLKEEPILHNVKTFLCRNTPDREYVLANLKNLVVKPVGESGGYGILVGPSSSQAQLDRYSKLIESEPENYVAQPTLSLSTGQTVVDNHYEPRHMDLRPFILSGKDTWVTSGGLTRVALTKGSLVVNSSQGGGSKDTWILDPQE